MYLYVYEVDAGVVHVHVSVPGERGARVRRRHGPRRRVPHVVRRAVRHAH